MSNTMSNTNTIDNFKHFQDLCMLNGDFEQFLTIILLNSQENHSEIFRYNNNEIETRVFKIPISIYSNEYKYVICSTNNKDPTIFTTLKETFLHIDAEYNNSLGFNKLNSIYLRMKNNNLISTAEDLNYIKEMYSCRSH